MEKFHSCPARETYEVVIEKPYFESYTKNTFSEVDFEAKAQRHMVIPVADYYGDDE